MSNFDNIDFSTSKGVVVAENYPQLVDESKETAELSPQVEVHEIAFPVGQEDTNNFMEKVELVSKIVFFFVVGCLGSLAFIFTCVFLPTFPIQVAIVVVGILACVELNDYKFFAGVSAFMCWVLLLLLGNMAGTFVYELFGLSSQNGDCTFFILNSF